MPIVDEEDAQSFKFPHQRAPKHHKIDMTNHEMCDKVQAQADLRKSLNGHLVGIKQGSSEDFVEVVQRAPLEMEDGGKAIIDEFQEINLGTTDDPKPIFVSTMLNDKEVVQYEQILQEYTDLFA